MRTAAFSPIAIVVLYVLAPTLAGRMLKSKRAPSSDSQLQPSIHTCDLQTLDTIDVEPGIYDSAIFGGFHGTSARPEKISDA